MAKHPSEMTDAEFNAALRDKAYRTKPDAAPPKPATLASEMTDEQFTQAMRNKAWRKGVTQ